jgi:hypothetical protein
MPAKKSPKKKAAKKRVFKAPPIESPDHSDLEKRVLELERNARRSRRLHFKLGQIDLD